MKKCSSCELEKSLSDFYMKRPEKGQRASECKSCVSNRGKRRWEEKGIVLRKARNLDRKKKRASFKSVPSHSEKKCSECNEVKKKSEFTASGWTVGYCRECTKRKNCEYRSKNSDRLKKAYTVRYDNGLKEKIVRSNRDRRGRQRRIVAELKASPCIDCHKTYPWYVMEFDHLKEKTQGVGVMVRRGWSMKRMGEELTTCELVCACCHRDRSKRRMPTASSYRPYEQKKRDFINSQKDVPCVDCGKRFLSHQMDFDHVRGEKVGILSRLFKRSWGVIRTELTKCEVRCANCHKARTYDRGQHLSEDVDTHLQVPA